MGNKQSQKNIISDKIQDVSTTPPPLQNNGDAVQDFVGIINIVDKLFKGKNLSNEDLGRIVDTTVKSISSNSFGGKKRRVSKRRVSKRRVSKRRVSKRRLSKRRVSKKRNY